jgi:hypothetical protein
MRSAGVAPGNRLEAPPGDKLCSIRYTEITDLGTHLFSGGRPRAFETRVDALHRKIPLPTSTGVGIIPTAIL